MVFPPIVGEELLVLGAPALLLEQRHPFLELLDTPPRDCHGFSRVIAPLEPRCHLHSTEPDVALGSLMNIGVMPWATSSKCGMCAETTPRTALKTWPILRYEGPSGPDERLTLSRACSISICRLIAAFGSGPSEPSRISTL